VVIAQIAPAVRVAMAETMGLAPGEVSVGQLVTGLRQLGFDYVFGKFACVQHQREVLQQSSGVNLNSTCDLL